MKYGFTTVLRLTNLSEIRLSAANKRGILALRSYHTNSAASARPLRLPSGHQSLLPLVRSCSNLILPHNNPCQPETPHCVMASRKSEGAISDEEIVVPFLISHDPSDKPVGYLRPQVVSAIEEDHQKHLISGSASPWDLRYSKDCPTCVKALAFADWVNEGGKFARTMHMERIVQDWQKREMFKDVLRSMPLVYFIYHIMHWQRPT